MPLLPYVRRELYLQAIKNRDASALPDPNNREELFLKAIAEETALIPSGVSVVLPAEVSEMLANLPEAHTHTERFYRDIIDAILVATTVTDTTPYLIRDTANHAPITSPARLTKKLGNTVCVNNMFNPANAHPWTQDGITVSFNSTTKKFTISGTATATIDKNIYSSGVDTVKGRKYAFISGFSGGSGSLGSGYELYVYGGNFGTYVGMNKINESTNGGGFAIYLKCQSGVAIPTQNFSIDIPDLSIWFGSNDRIPSDLLSHPENWGRYYAGSLDYNAGTLESADGTILTSKGADGTTVLAEVDTGSEPLFGDGTEENSDVKLPSGEITRKRARIDLGTLDYTEYESDETVTQYYTRGLDTLAMDNTTSGICAKFVQNNSKVPWTWRISFPIGKTFFRTSKDAYASADAFKTAMSGVYFEYPLATPTTEQGTAFNPVYDVEYGGTESWTNLKGIPQGHETEYTEFTT